MKLWGASLASILFVACNSEQTVLLRPPPSELAVTGNGIRPGSERTGVNTSLREPETVKVYGMNRYVDAGDPRIMHERHAIYRLEEQPAWVTGSPKNRNETILGPIVGLRKPEYAPEPMPGETAREVFQAKRGIQEVNDGMKELRENQERLAGSMASFAKESTDAQRKMTAVLSALNARVKRLEGDGAASGDYQTDEKPPDQGNRDIIVQSPTQ
ncbi:MAG TPA: hypothetical protein VE860_22635 [Chthoniobacterales bacterium]|nr:hypothetical protein [Chthoniobacterales bacterium]